jgi:hypothetical protein
MLYSKLGSIPKPETDGTEGWIEVPEAPAAPEGKEVVWWFPPGWVIRDPKPEGDWNWSQSEERWVESVVETEAAAETEVVVEGSEEIVAVGTAGSATSV